MTWLRIDDCLTDHPKIIGLSDGAFRLHISGLCYAARYLTDGFVPATYPKQISRQRFVSVLLDAGLWAKVTGGWQINDYLEYNPSKEKVESERAMRRSRAKAGSDARWHAKSMLEASPEHAPSIANDHAPDPTPTPSLDHIDQEDLSGGVRELLDAMGEHPRSQAHLEVLMWRGKGCSEFDLRSVARSVAAKRAKDPRSYAMGALRRRLAERGAA